MSRILAYTIIALFIAVSIILISARPDWVSDQNIFLKNFINHEYVNILGVILAITLASVANLHLEFNKIEERYNRKFLDRSRINLRKGAYWLIGLFVSGFIIVLVKPIIDGGATSEGVANMASLLILLWQVLILISITQLVFAIPANVIEGTISIHSECKSNNQDQNDP